MRLIRWVLVVTLGEAVGFKRAGSCRCCGDRCFLGTVANPGRYRASRIGGRGDTGRRSG
jgi:hypothetical protein